MKIILNNHKGSTNFKDALGELAQGAHTLSLAVSYLQVGGWELFRQQTKGIEVPEMRIVCTDQMGITHPEAVKRAIKDQVQIRNFTGNATYHPKVYLAHDAAGKPTRFLLGSANLSTSAFTTSTEAGIISNENSGLHTLNTWFNDLFSQKSAAFTPESLQQMELRWRAMAAARTQNRLRLRQQLITPADDAPLPVEPEDLDALEDVFATIQLPIGLLNMDYAANNVRNISKLRKVIADAAHAHGKQKSELKLNGFMADGRLSDLGRRAAKATNDTDFAVMWCRWLQTTDNAVLEHINPKLLIAKRVFSQFWRLKKEVRDYFLANAQQPDDRRLLQTIELLCNARDVVQELTLDDMRALSRLLEQTSRLPAYIRPDISSYFDNKGDRSWQFEDRRILPMAWQSAKAK